MQSHKCVRCSIARAGHWVSASVLCWCNMMVSGQLVTLGVTELSAATAFSYRDFGQEKCELLCTADFSLTIMLKCHFPEAVFLLPTSCTFRFNLFIGL